MRLSAFFLLLLLLLSAVAVPRSLLADTSWPYIGESSDKSLEATDKARLVLLADKEKMKNWTTEQWQAWADERFSASTSPDGSGWRDWRKARIKSSGDHTVLPVLEELNKPSMLWDADDWKLFIDNIDTDYRTSDQYFSVILPNGQDRGKFLLGRWAYAMYEDNLPERQAWDASASGGSDSGMSAEDVKLLLKMSQAQLEVLCFLAGLVTASIVAKTWKW